MLDPALSVQVVEGTAVGAAHQRAAGQLLE